MLGNPAIDRFADFVTLLLQHLAQFGHLRRVDGPLLVAVWNRVRAIQRQVEGLLARIAAGTLRRYPHRRPPPLRSHPRRPTPPALPIRRLWLVGLVQETARTASLLQDWLEDPQVTALLHLAPQIRCTLRPLCRMLGARLPQPPEPADPPDRAGQPGTLRPCPGRVVPRPHPRPGALPSPAGYAQTPADGSALPEPGM